MVASSHPPLTNAMTERPCELLHMDLVGPTRVRSVDMKWYVLVVVTTTLGMRGCSFFRRKGRRLVLFEILS
jgi:hypothetical protein